MDLGATVCTRSAPRCAQCPLAASCAARRAGRTGELPALRPPRPASQRRAHWLLVVGGGTVLLERRPPAGLWGGLLAPPSFASRRALAVAAQPFAVGLPLRRWPARRHAFTHFTLEFTPYLVESAPASVAGEPGWQWLPLATLEQAALPAPVRALLHEVRERVPAAARRRGAGKRARAATSAPSAASGNG
jgi:A/G-specific adenine glycosylase